MRSTDTPSFAPPQHRAAPTTAIAFCRGGAVSSRTALAAALAVFAAAAAPSARGDDAAAVDASEATSDAQTTLDVQATTQAELEEMETGFGAALGRVLATPAPDLWRDPDKDVDAMCGAPASAEPIGAEVAGAFGDRLSAAWTPPEPGPALATLVIELEVCLGPDGEALDQPRLLRPSGAMSAAQSAALLRAFEALRAAAPYPGPPTEYQPWRRILVVFDPVAAIAEDHDAPSPFDAAPGAPLDDAAVDDPAPEASTAPGAEAPSE